MKSWTGEPYGGQPSSTRSCQSPLSCATTWSWQVSTKLQRFRKRRRRHLLITTVCPSCHVVSLSVPLTPCRLRRSQCRAEGRSPLVVSPAAAGGAAVRDAEADRGQRGEAGGDRTQVPLDPGRLTTVPQHLSCCLWLLSNLFAYWSVIYHVTCVVWNTVKLVFLVSFLPRLNFSTAWSTNTVSICQSAGLANITRVELSRRFLIKVCTRRAGTSVTE